MFRRLLLLAALPVLAIGLAACGSSSKGSAASPGSGVEAGSQITIDSAFNFHTTSVAAGSTVTIKNDDSSSEHTVTQDGGGFNVTVPAGGTATFTAPATAGTYKFHCNIHNFMHGTLTVT